MKKVICIMGLSLLLLPACSTEQNRASQNSNNSMESARQERQEYQEKADSKLRELDQQIATLKSRLETEKNVDRKEVGRQMAELDRKRAEAQRQLDRLEHSSEGAWQDMKAGIDAAMDDLESAYHQAAAHFK
jgi:TolA-binding protein